MGDGRRLRRHPLGGPVLDRARPDRRERRLAADARRPPATFATLGVPASAAGPSLRELLVGSEGALGRDHAGRHARPRAARRRTATRAGSRARSPRAASSLRELEQSGLAPDVARLSDETETRVGLAMAGPGGFARRAGMAATRALGYGDGCLLVLGWEGEERTIAARRRPVANLLRRAGALPAGRGVGEGWARTRFAGPHLRDDLLDRGVLVETLETAASWTELERVRGAVAGALRGALGRPLVGCHVSHLYATGASLYFTVLARARHATTRPASGGARRRRRATRSPPPAPRSPTTTPSGATTRRGWRPSTGRSGSSCCARSRSAATPPGS